MLYNIMLCNVIFTLCKETEGKLKLAMEQMDELNSQLTEKDSRQKVMEAELGKVLAEFERVRQL